MAKKSTPGRKADVRKREVKLPHAKDDVGAPFSEQDPKRRLGQFTGTGEHARKGGRTSGIVGQTTKRSRTDKARKK